MRSSLTAMSSPQPFEQRRHAECTQRSGSPSHSTRPSCRGCIGGSLALCRWTGKGCADRVSGCIAWPLARFRACRYCPTAATHPGVVVAESSGDVGGLSRSGAPSTRGRRDFVSGRSSSSSFGVGRAPLPAPGTSAASGRDTSPVAAGVEARSFGRQSASTASLRSRQVSRWPGTYLALFPGAQARGNSPSHFQETTMADNPGKNERVGSDAMRDSPSSAGQQKADSGGTRDQQSQSGTAGQQNPQSGSSGQQQSRGGGTEQQQNQASGNRDQQTRQSGAMGQPAQGGGSSSATSVGSSGNYGSGGQQGQRDAGGRDQEAQTGRAGQQGQGSDQGAMADRGRSSGQSSGSQPGADPSSGGQSGNQSSNQPGRGGI